MDESQITHQNKVKLMGTILIIVAILSAVGAVVGLTVAGIAHQKYGDQITFKEWFSHFDIEDKTGNNEDVLEEIRNVLGADSQEVKELEAAIEESKQADRELDEFVESMSTEPLNLKAIFQAAVIGTILTLIISVLLVMIGRSWRKVEPFSSKVVIGLRGLGIVFLIQTFLPGLLPDPEIEDVGAFSSDLSSFGPHEAASSAPLFSLGLLLLTLSWVIAHGRKLTEETQLTI